LLQPTGLDVAWAHATAEERLHAAHGTTVPRVRHRHLDLGVRDVDEDGAEASREPSRQREERLAVGRALVGAGTGLLRHRRADLAGGHTGEACDRLLWRLPRLARDLQRSIRARLAREAGTHDRAHDVPTLG